MKLYKLTNKHGRTYGECQWGEGVEHSADGEGPLCSEHWIHAYGHPLLAVLHDMIHGQFLDDKGARLWECESNDENPMREGQMKLGVRHLCTVRQIPIPEITFEQRVAYAIHCALHVYIEPDFVDWAEGWLSGKNRLCYAAYAAYADAAYAADAAAYADAAYDAYDDAGSIDLAAIAEQVCDTFYW